MAETATRAAIVAYLAERGGSVASADGRGLAAAIAASIGSVTSTAVTVLLAGMEEDGVIVRVRQGLLTYRIALGPAVDPPATMTVAPNTDVGMVSKAPAQAAMAEKAEPATRPVPSSKAVKPRPKPRTKPVAKGTTVPAAAEAGDRVLPDGDLTPVPDEPDELIESIAALTREQRDLKDRLTSALEALERADSDLLRRVAVLEHLPAT